MLASVALAAFTEIGSTIPSNGDLNPYGVAIATEDIGVLKTGDVLVSNFNDHNNLQGKGTTIVRFPNPKGSPVANQLFAQINASEVHCDGGVGLTTALVVLKGGWVIVGSLPTQNGSSSTAGRGCLIVLDAYGSVVSTIQHRLINGPWDMTAYQHGKTAYLFVSNVLNGDVVVGNPHVVNKGTVVRLTLKLACRSAKHPILKSAKVIGSGFSQKADPAALIIGPTGLALDGDDLFVADTLNNRIARIPDAIHRRDSAYAGYDVAGAFFLNAPLGLAFSKHFSILAANGGDSNVVQISETGDQLPTIGTGTGSGGLFGIAINLNDTGFYFVNDNANNLNLFTS